MKQLRPASAWMDAVDSCELENFRSGAQQVLQRHCPCCHLVSTLLYNDSVDPGVMCMDCANCGARLLLHLDNRIELEYKNSDKTYCDYLRGLLAEKGIDWKTETIQPIHSNIEKEA